MAALDYLFIENVGNLVCPAVYDLGQDVNVVALSVTEGEDKPLKYPTMFRKADLVLLTKIDLLPVLPDISVAPNPREPVDRDAAADHDLRVGDDGRGDRRVGAVARRDWTPSWHAVRDRCWRACPRVGPSCINTEDTELHRKHGSRSLKTVPSVLSPCAPW